MEAPPRIVRGGASAFPGRAAAPATTPARRPVGTLEQARLLGVRRPVPSQSVLHPAQSGFGR